MNSNQELEHILNALGNHRVDNYHEWVKVGMALHHESEANLGLWTGWSSRSSKYKPGQCEEKWKSFAKSGNGKSVGLGTLVVWAKQDTPDFKPKVNGRAPLRTAAQIVAPKKEQVTEAKESPALELAERAESIINGTLKDIQFGPWTQLSRVTQALLPGTITLLCGGQGLGKSLFAIEACLEWLKRGIKFKYLGIEENRVFYLDRALAQIAGNANFTNYEYKRNNPDIWRSAFTEHMNTINALGNNICEVDGAITSKDILDWVKSQIAQNQILVIDPITATDSGQNVAQEDKKLMNDLRTLVKANACAVILVTHPKKMSAGAKKESMKGWGDDVSGGAAFERFAATVFSLVSNGNETVNVKTEMGVAKAFANRRIRINKTRNGFGSWFEIAYYFDNKTLRYTERGILTNGATKTVKEAPDPDSQTMFEETF